MFRLVDYIRKVDGRTAGKRATNLCSIHVLAFGFPHGASHPRLAPNTRRRRGQRRPRPFLLPHHRRQQRRHELSNDAYGFVLFLLTSLLIVFDRYREHGS